MPLHLFVCNLIYDPKSQVFMDNLLTNDAKTSQIANRFTTKHYKHADVTNCARDTVMHR